MKISDLFALYPGASAAISGVLAIVVTFHTPRSTVGKIAWLLIFAGLGITAIVASIAQQNLVVKKEEEQRKSQDQMTKDFAYMQGQMTALVRFTSKPAPPNEEARRLALVLERLESEIRSGRRSEQADPKLNLKKRGLILSSEILRYLGDREKAAPPLPRRETWQEDTDKIIRYFQETMSIYSQKFAGRVLAIHNEFAELGLRTEELDRFYEHPTNPLGVKAVGEQIGALSERIK